MTVLELRKLLETFPDDMTILLRDEVWFANIEAVYQTRLSLTPSTYHLGRFVNWRTPNPPQEVVVIDLKG